MKRFFIYTLICSLTALIGCDKNDEVMNDLATTNGKKVTVTANIQGDAATRVTLTQDDADPTKPIVKVDWKASGETFEAYAEGETTPIVFRQTADTEDSKNLFEGALPETPAEYTVYYSKKDYYLSEQDGTLNEAYVLMQATTDFSTTIDFEHKTAILKPTFIKVDDAVLANNTITQIVMEGIKNPSAETDSGSITVMPSTLGDIYIFLPAFESYTAGHTFTFIVTASGQDYQATLTIPNGKSIEAGKFYTATIKLTIPYLTFTAQGAQTFKMNTEFEYILPNTLQYSVGGNAWTQLNAGASINFGGANGNLRLRGKSITGTAEDDMNYSWIEFENNTPVACTGDIRTLVDWEKYNTVSTSDARFCRLFNGCNALTTAPALPADTLAVDCYSGMFRNCTNLTAAPTLPADTLAEGCYHSMFYGCTSLETAPATLPATTLADYCYNEMFRGCTSLTTAPALPAIELADYCYQSMFRDCTSLATAPATLPATTLANYCYNFMFQGCTSLETAPALLATTLAVDCYSGMFYGCTSLATAPTLSATTLAEGCYYSMFNNCTSLETAPALQATTLAPFCYSYMFKNCTSLTAAPVLPATTLANNCYSEMFYGCTSLTAAPALPAATLAKDCYFQMFKSCTSLNSITMLATDITASFCLYEWVSGVAASGTFYKNSAATWNVTGTNGVPSGWDVEIVTP